MTPDDHAFLSLILIWLIALMVAVGAERLIAKLPRPKLPRRRK